MWKIGEEYMITRVWRSCINKTSEFLFIVNVKYWFFFFLPFIYGTASGLNPRSVLTNLLPLYSLSLCLRENNVRTSVFSFFFPFKKIQFISLTGCIYLFFIF